MYAVRRRALQLRAPRRTSIAEPYYLPQRENLKMLCYNQAGLFGRSNKVLDNVRHVSGFLYSCWRGGGLEGASGPLQTTPTVKLTKLCWNHALQFVGFRAGR